MNTNLFTDDFQKASFIERCAFKNLIKLYDPFLGDYDYTIKETPYTGNDLYDFWINIFDNNGRQIKTYFVEVKVRTYLSRQQTDINDLEGWIYETKKDNDLKKLIDSLYLKRPDEAEIIYVNFTHNGTYLWFIDRIRHNMDKTEIVANKATMASRDEKKKKYTYLLKPYDGLQYNYIWDERQIETYLQDLVKPKVDNFVKKNRGLNDILF